MECSLTHDTPLLLLSHVQLCDPTDSSTPGFPALDYLLEFAQQHTRLSCPWLSPGVCSDSRPLIQWCYLSISSSVISFSSCLQPFPASESFPMSQLFASGGQSTGASALASVLPMIIQCWYPLGLTILIFLQSRGLSRVFSSTTTWKHQFFGAQFSFWSNSHIHTWLLEKPWYTEWKPLDI